MKRLEVVRGVRFGLPHLLLSCGSWVTYGQPYTVLQSTKNLATINEAFNCPYENTKEGVTHSRSESLTRLCIKIWVTLFNANKNVILFNANSCKEFIIKFMIILCFISNEKYYFISLMEVFLRIVIFEVLLQKWRYWSTETAGFFTRTRKLAKSFSKFASSFNFS